VSIIINNAVGDTMTGMHGASHRAP